MKVDLHNHTTLCNHAEGSIEQYIEKAIQSKIKYFGFADHAPMNFDPKYRMSFQEMQSYEKAILKAKEKYQDKINILLGYEVDYLENHIDERVLNADVDYLIGSVHFLDGWGFDNPEFIGDYETKNIDEIWRLYFKKIEQMAQTNFFDIVGHFDLIKVFKFMPKTDIKELAYNALKAIKAADMALEINMAGYRKPIAEAYPSLDILTLAYQLNIDITFASDAHKPEQIAMFSKEVVALAKQVGYTQCVIFHKRKKEYINL